MWGRETGRLALDTTTGPSWKPFPVLFTTLFAPAGDAAPALWLIVARAGGLLALAGAYVLAARLAGRWAGAAAAAAMALSPWWLFNTALGNSEGLLAAAVLWAVIAHLAGRPRAALALATAARADAPGGVAVPRRLRRLAVATRPPTAARWSLAGVLVPLLWFGPDVLGAGGALGASHTARGVPSPGSAKLASTSRCSRVLGDTATLLTLPALVAAVVGGGPRRSARALDRRRGRGVDRDRGGDDRRRLRRQPALPRRRRRVRRALRARARCASPARSAPPCSSPPCSP